MSKQLYECDICAKQYKSEKEANKCENTHKEVLEQMKIVAQEIYKLYKLGGKISLSIGSHYSRLEEMACFTDYNTLAGKAGTCWHINQPILRINSYDKMPQYCDNNYFLDENTMVFIKSEKEMENYKY